MWTICESWAAPLHSLLPKITWAAPKTGDMETIQATDQMKMTRGRQVADDSYLVQFIFISTDIYVQIHLYACYNRQCASNQLSVYIYMLDVRQQLGVCRTQNVYIVQVRAHQKERFWRRKYCVSWRQVYWYGIWCESSSCSELVVMVIIWWKGTLCICSNDLVIMEQVVEFPDSNVQHWIWEVIWSMCDQSLIQLPQESCYSKPSLCTFHPWGSPVHMSLHGAAEQVCIWFLNIYFF